MKLNLLKGFAAMAILCMVGAVLAEPVALGDISAYYLYEHSKNRDYYNAGQDAITLYGAGKTIAEGAGYLALVSETGAEAGLLAAGVATGGVALIAIGIGVAA
jgi:hypothetical protein